jgi:drug/metabolite transporter (DMT)-like permease
MILGSLIALAVAFSKNEHFVFDSSPKYIFSLAYLVLIPGIVGFVGILHLISKIGSSKAAYTSLIYPVGALAISAMFENYHFGLISIFGLVMIIAGNYLALRSKK